MVKVTVYLLHLSYMSDFIQRRNIMEELSKTNTLNRLLVCKKNYVLTRN